METTNEKFYGVKIGLIVNKSHAYMQQKGNGEIEVADKKEEDNKPRFIDIDAHREFIKNIFSVNINEI